MGRKNKKEHPPVPNRLKELREAHGWSMRKAADHCGIKYTTYISWEQRKREMDSEDLIKVATGYNVTIDYLLYHDVEPVVLIKPPIAQKYEALDEKGQSVVDAVIKAQEK